ncbi:MAG: ABC transporter permease [Lachnospiraceae bacterium]|nr:ABC transporter permease [Lachnospiraceae bacterium]
MAKKITAFVKKYPAFTVFFLLALCVIGVAVFAPLIATHDPYEAVLADAVQAPSAEHWFGTDKMGRDLFSRVIYGARTSLSASLTLVCIIMVVGTFLGIIAGYFGGLVDAVIMRISDMMISFPGMVLAIAVAGILGANIKNAIIALAIVSWTKYARLARSLVIKIRHRDYIAAARVTGSRTSYILYKYMLPNVLPTILITGFTDIGSMMLEIAGLSFLGFGAQSPTAEWGLMLNEGRAYMTAAPWLMVFPGLAIFITVVVFNLLGDSLRDVLDPRHE